MLPVVFSSSAKKYFKKLNDKHLKQKYKNAVLDIKKNPKVGEEKKGDLAGIMSYNIYYQGNNYEVAYHLSKNEKGKIVIVIMAGTRGNFYKNLKKNMK